MVDSKPIKVEGRLLTPDQLCDALEVYLGREKGTQACRALLTKLEHDPSWRAQLNTMSCTVQVFQECDGVEVPDEVSYRLMHTLNLNKPGETCEDDEA